LEHDVISVQEDRPGIEDPEVCDWANREGRVIITNDKGFGKLVFKERLANRKDAGLGGVAAAGVHRVQGRSWSR